MAYHQYAEYLKRKIKKLKSEEAEDINCYYCGKLLATCYPFDLEETYFYCNDCIAKKDKIIAEWEKKIIELESY